MVNSISQKKSLSRLLAVQAIFQMEASGQTLNKVKIEFEKYRAKTELMEFIIKILMSSILEK